MNEGVQTPGPFVIAKQTINAAGWPAFSFGQTSYVHKHAHAAEQEARRLARKHSATFSVFRHWATVTPEPDEAVTQTIDLHRLAGAIARSIQSSNMHMSIESARFHVDTAIKSLE